MSSDCALANTTNRKEMSKNTSSSVEINVVQITTTSQVESLYAKVKRIRRAEWIAVMRNGVVAVFISLVFSALYIGIVKPFAGGALTPSQLTLLTWCTWAILLKGMTMFPFTFHYFCDVAEHSCINTLSELSALFYVMFFLSCTNVFAKTRKPISRDNHTALLLLLLAGGLLTLKRINKFECVKTNKEKSLKSTVTTKDVAAAITDKNDNNNALQNIENDCKEVEKSKELASKPCIASLPHNRYQTEEWRGWMQIYFILYHTISDTEIRYYIYPLVSAFVWMTGFGNFLYFMKTNDYSFNRFCNMVWRLNFFVFIAVHIIGQFDIGCYYAFSTFMFTAFFNETNIYQIICSALYYFKV